VSQALPSTQLPERTSTHAAAPAGVPARRRTPLSLVSPRPASRRVPFAVFSFGALVAALATVLVLNISVTSGQYELVTLRNQQTVLAQQNQALTQQVEDLGAPQNLAAAAAKLGMVASADFGVIDVDSMKATRAPKAAAETGGARVSVAAPDVATARDAAAAEAARKAETGRSAGPARTQGQAPAKRKAATRTIADLNGGTIPAPQQGGFAE
jgi:cell division protein FtsL